MREEDRKEGEVAGLQEEFEERGQEVIKLKRAIYASDEQMANPGGGCLILWPEPYGRVLELHT